MGDDEPFYGYGIVNAAAAVQGGTVDPPVTITYTPPFYFGLPFYGTILVDDPVDIDVVSNGPVIDTKTFLAYPVDNGVVIGSALDFGAGPIIFTETILEEEMTNTFDIYVEVTFVGGDPDLYVSDLIVEINVVFDIIIPPKPKK